MSKGEKTRMNVTLSSCFVLPFFRICNPKVSLIRILNPNNKALGLQTPKDEAKGIKGVGAIPCSRLYINGQRQGTAPTYATPSFWIYNPKAILIRILKSL